MPKIYTRIARGATVAKLDRSIFLYMSGNVAAPATKRGRHSAFAEATLPRDGQVGEGVSPALDAQTEKHNDPRRLAR